MRGPIEEALIGAPIADPTDPVEVGHVARSFDSCLVCTVHAHDAKTGQGAGALPHRLGGKRAPTEAMSMQQWKPQIRTNLDEPVYQLHLDRVLEGVPGGIAAALVNTRFHEGCVRLPGRGAGSAAQTGDLVSLLSGWFAADASAVPAGYAAALAPLRPCGGFSLNFQTETLMAARLGDGARVLVLAVPSSLNLGASLALLHVAEGQMSGTSSALAAALEPSDDVLVGLLVDVRTGAVLDRYERFAGASVIDTGERLVAVLRGLFTTDAPAAPLVVYDREDGQPLELRRAEVVASDRRLHCSRVPFDPEHVLMLSADKRVAQGLLWTVAQGGGDRDRAGLGGRPAGLRHQVDDEPVPRDPAAVPRHRARAAPARPQRPPGPPGHRRLREPRGRHRRGPAALHGVHLLPAERQVVRPARAAGPGRAALVVPALEDVGQGLASSASAASTSNTYAPAPFITYSVMYQSQGLSRYSMYFGRRCDAPETTPPGM